MFVHEGEVFVDRGRADVVFDEGTFEQDEPGVGKRIADPHVGHLARLPAHPP